MKGILRLQASYIRNISCSRFKHVYKNRDFKHLGRLGGFESPTRYSRLMKPLGTAVLAPHDLPQPQRSHRHKHESTTEVYAKSHAKR